MSTKLIKKEQTNNILTKEDEIKLARLLIQNNIDQPPLFHIKILKNNNINRNKFKIKNLVYELQKARILCIKLSYLFRR